MQNLKEVVNQRIENSNWTKELISSSLSMSRTGLWQALENNSLKLEKINILFQILDIEPNMFFEWQSTRSVDNGNLERKNEGLDTVDVSSMENAFLRNQIVVLNNQIDDLIKTIKNMSERK